jgi:hypothetical protein
MRLYNKVVLPEPLAPSSARHLPSSKSKLTPFKTNVPSGYEKDKLFTLIMGIT